MLNKEKFERVKKTTITGNKWELSTYVVLEEEYKKQKGKSFAGIVGGYLNQYDLDDIPYGYFEDYFNIKSTKEALRLVFDPKRSKELLEFAAWFFVDKDLINSQENDFNFEQNKEYSGYLEPNTSGGISELINKISNEQTLAILFSHLTADEEILISDAYGIDDGVVKSRAYLAKKYQVSEEKLNRLLRTALDKLRINAYRLKKEAEKKDKENKGM